jgi:hypothetical protein
MAATWGMEKVPILASVVAKGEQFRPRAESGSKDIVPFMFPQGLTGPAGF